LVQVAVNWWGPRGAPSLVVEGGMKEKKSPAEMGPAGVNRTQDGKKYARPVAGGGIFPPYTITTVTVLKKTKQTKDQEEKKKKGNKSAHRDNREREAAAV